MENRIFVFGIKLRSASVSSISFINVTDTQKRKGEREREEKKRISQFDAPHMFTPDARKIVGVS